MPSPFLSSYFRLIFLFSTFFSLRWLSIICLLVLEILHTFNHFTAAAFFSSFSSPLTFFRTNRASLMDPTSSTFAIYFDRVKFNCNFIYSRQLFPSQQFFGFLIDRRALNFGHTRNPVSVEFSSFLKHENSIKNIYLFLRVLLGK